MVKFRKDINGLRAIAVLAVVLFHFNPLVLPGGFAGVDIFFVISGFLMTRIIFTGLEANTFSLGRFYKARASRIVPPLAVLCLTMLTLGWFYFTPTDYRTLSSDALNSITFISNFFYGGDAGYFDETSKERWLLHTWSLSAEWQFYIVFPLLLLFLKKLLPLQTIKFTLVIATVIGLLYSVFATYQTPEQAYFLLPSRAWEMLIGGLVYLYPCSQLNDRSKKALAWLGLALILASYLFISEATPWPGYLALLPVLGAVLILQANRMDSRVTGNGILQKIGLWSYSIYLWHWPIAVVGGYLELGEYWPYIGMPLSVFIGWLSYSYIEQFNFKARQLSWKNILVYPPLLMVLLVAVLAGLAKNNSASPLRIPAPLLSFINNSQRVLPQGHCRTRWDDKGSECFYGKGELGAIVLGDSHAGAMLGMISRAMPDKAVLDWTISLCPTIDGVYESTLGVKDTSCGDFVNYALSAAKQQYPGVPIIIINRSSQNLYGRNEKPAPLRPERFVGREFAERDDAYRQSIAEGMITTVCTLAETNPVYIVRPIPELKQNVFNIKARALMTGTAAEQVSISLTEYHERQALAWQIQDQMAAQCGVQIINPLPYLCDDASCYGERAGQVLYYDDDHLNELGSEWVKPAFAPFFTQIQGLPLPGIKPEPAVLDS